MLLPLSLLLFLSSTLVEVGVNTGWMVYLPLSGIISHFRGSVDLAIFNLHLSSVSTTRNFGFCNCRLQLKFNCMRHMQLQICVVA
jgi:cytochrome c oxidase subunit 1